MEDMMSAVGYLQSLAYVDQKNMGLFGWSFGGFNTVDFMLNHPDVFKAAVAGGPVTDWSYYEIMYTERYMDTPQENPEGYAATNLTNKIDKLKGKLLLIHGLQDNVVVQQHSVKLVRAAIDKNIQVDYMIYPGHEHNVLGKDRAHLYQKVSDYFTQNLSKENAGVIFIASPLIQTLLQYQVAVFLLKLVLAQLQVQCSIALVVLQSLLQFHRYHTAISSSYSQFRSKRSNRIRTMIRTPDFNFRIVR